MLYWPVSVLRGASWYWHNRDSYRCILIPVSPPRQWESWTLSSMTSSRSLRRRLPVLRGTIRSPPLHPARFRPQSAWSCPGSWLSTRCRRVPRPWRNSQVPRCQTIHILLTWCYINTTSLQKWSLERVFATLTWGKFSATIEISATSVESWFTPGSQVWA